MNYLKKDRDRWKISKQECARIAVVIFAGYSFYADLIDRVNHYYLSLLFLIVSCFFGLVSLIKDRRFIIQKQQLRFMAGWVALTFFFVLIRNQWIEHGMFWRTIRWCWAVLMLFCIINNDVFSDNLVHIIAMIGFPNVIATLLFFVFRRGYSIMYRIWSFYPPGTVGGVFGYKAGLTNHYSHNATLISIILLIFTAELICLTYKDYQGNNRKFRLAALSLCSLFGLILTAKRAHFIFSVIAVLFLILLFVERIQAKKLASTVLVLIVLCAGYYFAYSRVPELRVLQERLFRTGQDYSSSLRFQMWRRGLTLFKENPVFGIGWGGYRYNTIYGIETHNVYIQLLAETGVVGFLIYVLTNAHLFILGIINTKRNIEAERNDLAITSSAALLIQTFFLLYSLTGNGLYDITFNYYIIAIGAVYLCAS